MMASKGYKNLKNVGTRLRAWRKNKRLKSGELAKLIKVSQGSLSDIENNKSLPSAETIAKLHAKTDLNVLYLLTGVKDEKPNELGCIPREEVLKINASAVIKKIIIEIE